MGRHLVYSLVQERRHTDVIICLVREKKVECEQSYWDAHLSDLDESEQFKADYDNLLSSTGLADAAELAGRFGIDLHKIDFWRGSMDVIRRDIDRFEALVEERVQAGVVY